MILLAYRAFGLICALSLAVANGARAEPLLIEFTARIGVDSANVLDNDNLFGEGHGANLKSQLIFGQVAIDAAALTTEPCGVGGCYADLGAGAVSVSFTLKGVTSTVVSTGTLGYFGNSSGGSVQISDATNGLDNYVGVGATTPDGMVQQSIGALFNDATLFSASNDPGLAVASLLSIGGGAGLVKGGITLLTPDEHIDATILTIDVPEPAGLLLLAVALAGLGMVRRKIAA